MRRYRRMGVGIIAGTLLAVTQFGCASQKPPEIRDTWSAAAQRATGAAGQAEAAAGRAEAAAGRAEMAAGRTEEAAQRVEAAAERLETHVVRHMNK